MTRSLLLASVAVLAIAMAACGDGPDVPATPTASATPTVTPTTRPAPPPGLPTPKPAAETDRALTAGSRGRSYDPTVAEFRALPATEIDTPAGKRRGVLLSVIASKVEASSTDMVTFEGRPADQRIGGYVRGLLSDLGSTTVLAIDERGHVGLVSSRLPETEWLTYVASISFAK